MPGFAKIPVSYDFNRAVMEDALLEARIWPDKKIWELLNAIEDNAWDNKIKKDLSEIWD